MRLHWRIMFQNHPFWPFLVNYLSPLWTQNKNKTIESLKSSMCHPKVMSKIILFYHKKYIKRNDQQYFIQCLIWCFLFCSTAAGDLLSHSLDWAFYCFTFRHHRTSGADPASTRRPLASLHKLTIVAMPRCFSQFTTVNKHCKEFTTWGSCYVCVCRWSWECDENAWNLKQFNHRKKAIFPLTPSWSFDEIKSTVFSQAHLQLINLPSNVDQFYRGDNPCFSSKRLKECLLLQKFDNIMQKIN